MNMSLNTFVSGAWVVIIVILVIAWIRSKKL
jgi:hypothetical protein